MTDQHSDVRFDHTIIPATDKHRSAAFSREFLGSEGASPTSVRHPQSTNHE